MDISRVNNDDNRNNNSRINNNNSSNNGYKYVDEESSYLNDIEASSQKIMQNVRF